MSSSASKSSRIRLGLLRKRSERLSDGLSISDPGKVLEGVVVVGEGGGSVGQGFSLKVVDSSIDSYSSSSYSGISYYNHACIKNNY